MEIEEIIALKNKIPELELDFDKNLMIENILLHKPEGFFDVVPGMDIICAAAGLGAAGYFFGKCEKYSYNPFDLFSKTNYARFCIDFRENKKEDFRCSFLNPYDAKNCTIGAKTRSEADYLANVCLNLGYTNSLTMTGEQDFAYVTPAGESYIAEAWKNKIFTCTLNPKMLGLQEYGLDLLKVENEEENKEILKGIFEGKIKNAPCVALILNSALALYITKKAKSIPEGLDLARGLISSGKAGEKYFEIEKLKAQG